MKKVIFFVVLFFYSFAAGNVENLNDENNYIPNEDVNIAEKIFICDKLDDSKIFFSLANKEETKKFYESYCQGKSKLAWFSNSLDFNKQSLELIKSIKSSYHHGLNPSKYHKNKILHYAPKIIDKEFDNVEDKYYAVNRLDALLTDAYISLAKDLYYGFSDWSRVLSISESRKEKFQWDRQITYIDIIPYLLRSHQNSRVLDSLVNLLPDFDEYYRLIESLKYYRSLKVVGGWEKIPAGPSIKNNKKDKRVPLLKNRLYITGDLKEIKNIENLVYNEKDLIEAVKFFQIRHNIKDDGVIGLKTLEALNISLIDKINKIILNLERYRWLPRGIDKSSYVNVNIPAYSMQLLEYDEEVFGMNVVVGRKNRPTPMLQSNISYIVLNPYWTAPKTIVSEDIVRKADKVEKYVTSHNMKVYRINSDGRASQIGVNDVNWSNYAGKKHVPFMFKALPGSKNPLGTVKFMFSNKYSVYIHDTNSKSLFNRDRRSYSSGCVRLHEPIKLLKYIIEKEEKNYESVDNILKKGKNHRIYLNNTIPIIFRYMTAGVDKNYNTYFYDDIYGYDDIHIEAIRKKK